jgi:hypothetical protein
MEITLIYKQSGRYWTAAAFLGKAFAGCSTHIDRQQAGENARALAEHLVQHGELSPIVAPEAARLGGRAKVRGFSLALHIGRQPLGVLQAAQLAALAAPIFPVDEAAAALAAAA